MKTQTTSSLRNGRLQRIFFSSFVVVIYFSMIKPVHAQTAWHVSSSNTLYHYTIARLSKQLIDIDTFGQVWLGTGGVSPDYALSVKGKMRAREIYVNADAWADYVFDNGYKLLPINQLESYVHLHKHLPGIPAASEIIAKDVSVGDVQRRLLEKIEELTLYVIQQQKEIETLKSSLVTK